MHQNHQRDYHLFEGDSLRQLQKMIHGSEPVAHSNTAQKPATTGYTPAGLVRLVFGFSR